MDGAEHSIVRDVATSYVADLRALLERVDLEALDRVVQRLRAAREVRASIFVAGNGGSAATASHWVNDLGKATKVGGGTPMRVVALCDNVSWMTALANDEGYDRVFAGQLENFAQPGDVLVVISASGNSPNLLRAVELAKQRGMATVAFLGFDGGRLRGMVDEVVWVESEVGLYGIVESAHSVVLDIVATCLIRDRAASLLSR